MSLPTKEQFEELKKEKEAGPGAEEDHGATGCSGVPTEA